LASNTSALAGEYLVAGELSRRGYLVSITMGNAKAIDIFACTKDRKKTIKIDVKASKCKTSWPAGEIKEDMFYVFVSLHKPEKLIAIKGVNIAPEYYIIPGEKAKSLVNRYARGMSDIRYHAVQEYKERWDLLPSP
jgi:hypothetical protein